MLFWETIDGCPYKHHFQKFCSKSGAYRGPSILIIMRTLACSEKLLLHWSQVYFLKCLVMWLSTAIWEQKVLLHPSFGHVKRDFSLFLELETLFAVFFSSTGPSDHLSDGRISSDRPGPNELTGSLNRLWFAGSGCKSQRSQKYTTNFL